MQQGVTEVKREKKVKKKSRVKYIRNWGHFFKKLTLKIVSKLLLFIGFSVALLLIVVQFSFFQTMVLHQFLPDISNRLGFQIKIKNFYFDWVTSKIRLREVSIRDPNGKQMLFAKNLRVNFDYNTVLQKGDILLNEALLVDATVNLITDKKTGVLNLTQFIDRIDSLISAGKAPKKEKKGSARFLLEKVRIQNSFLGITNESKPFLESEGMDYNHLNLDSLNVDADNLMVLGDTIEIQMNKLSAYEIKTKTSLKKLSCFYRMTDHSMEFRNLECRVGNSVLRKQLFFNYTQPKDLSEFVDKVSIVAYLDNTEVDTKDLQAFAPAVKIYNDVWKVSGIFRGKVSDFAIKDLDLYLGKNSHFQGRVDFSGLPDFNQTFMQLRFKESVFLGRELNQYVNNQDVAYVFDKLGRVRFDGNFIGFHSDFVADGVFVTDIGRIESDINLKLKRDQSQSRYKGKLKTSKFNLGALLDSDRIQTIDMDGSIEGQGFTPETANLKLDAKIQSLVFNRYDYHSITVDGEMSQKRFKGELLAEDPNFNMDVKGEIDFYKDAKNPELPFGKFDLKSEVFNVSLHTLNFSPVETTIKGKIDIDTYGLSLDSIVGEALVSDVSLLYNKKSLEIKSLDFLAFKNEKQERFFEMHSDFVDVQVVGNYVFSRLLADLQELSYEYWLSFKNDLKEIEAYYTKKKSKEQEKYAARFEVELKNINPVLSLFNEKVRLSKDAHFKGKFSRGRTSSFSLSTQRNITALNYNNLLFEDINIDLNSSKITEGRSILAEGTITSSKQTLGTAKFENTYFNAVWGENLINFDFTTQQADRDNSAHLSGELQFKGDTTQIAFKNSYFQLLKEKWFLEPDNHIYISQEDIEFYHLDLFKEKGNNSRLSINGFISEDVKKTLGVEIQDIEIFSFADFLNLDFRGNLNGSAVMSRIFTNPEVEANLHIENLMKGKVLIGDLDGKVDWDNTNQHIDLNFDLYRRGKYILDVFGEIKPGEKEKQLNLVAEFHRTDLEIFEPFVSFLASDLRGGIDGKVEVKGKISQPEVNGKLSIKNGKFKINYLQTAYDLEGDVTVLPQQFVANNLVLTDEDNNPATARFSLFHDGFKEFYLKLNSRFYDFQLLNTSEKDNSLFYGTAFASGTFKIEGPLNKLKMDINAKSKKGTKLAIPLDGYAEIAKKEYIRFVSYADTTNKNKPKQIELGGLTMNFNLEVTPDAQFEIIFDRKAGDIIRGQGTGNIKLVINSAGEFNIFGNYIIQKGKYNFTFANLVNKGFDVQPGSTITFNGDMYQSVLDIRAMYRKFVSVRPLLDLESIPDPDNPEYRRTYSVSALMDLKGILLSPEIKLGLDLAEIKRVPNINIQNAILQLDNRVRSDEQELSRQVFSLLILNRLSPLNSFSGVGGAAGSSLSELLSNQFSNWISQIDQNLELSFDIDAEDFNSFQMRVSYSLMDGRLRISREGGFNNAQRQADFASVIGDWTVEYLLSSSGRYRIKMYNRTNLNFNSALNASGTSFTTTGASLMHTANFNTFSDLFKSKKKRLAEEREQFFKEDFEPKTKTGEDDKSDQTQEKQETIILKPRFDEVKPVKNPYQDEEEDPKKENENKNPPPNPKKNEQEEGDEDNEPMPDKYKNDKNDNKEIVKELPEEKKKELPKEKEIPGKDNRQRPSLPLKHRFDPYKNPD